MKKILLLAVCPVFLFASVGHAQTYTYQSTAGCQGSTSSLTPNCSTTVATSVGDLVLITSHSASSTASGVSATLGFTGTSICASPTQIGSIGFQPNGGGTFVAAVFACIATSAGTTTPQVTWVGTASTFSDITYSNYTSTTGFPVSFLDQNSTWAVASTASVNCPTGATSATTNAIDLVVPLCMVFNAAQTWGSLAGFTNEATSSRTTIGLYDGLVTSTGVQSKTVPLSASDVGLGTIIAFKLNVAASNHFDSGKIFAGGKTVQQ